MARNPCWMLSALSAAVDVLQVTAGSHSCFKARLHSITFRRVTSESWLQILPWSSAEEANAASHASHCWRHVCVPATQCTCAPRSWLSPAPWAGNNGFYLCRLVAVKQSRPKPGLLPNLGTDAGMCVQDTSPRHKRIQAVPHWHVGKRITKRHWRSCWSMVNGCAKAKEHHFEHLLNWNQLFSEPPTVYRAKRYFYASLLDSSE